VSEWYVIGIAVAAGGTVVIFALCLVFLLVIYLASGRNKDHLEAGANAIHKIRDVGVASAVRAALEQRSNRGAGSS